MIIEDKFCTIKKTEIGSFISLTEVGDSLMLDAIRYKDEDPSSLIRHSMLLTPEAIEALKLCIADYHTHKEGKCGSTTRKPK